MYLLAIESSCDETACAIVSDGVHEISSVVASSADLHEATGGVVPEVAARKQLEFIVPVIESTLTKALDILPISKENLIASIDAIAVTVGPGLVGSLLVGIEAAKALALAWNKPIIPVNHLVGHIYANFIEYSDSVTGKIISPSIEFPAIALVVSGGHTDLVLMHGHNKLQYLGGTCDDAAGEAFDKVARILGLAKYLGGAAVSKKALECKNCGNNRLTNKLPRPKIQDIDWDFSFSGLKTATKRILETGQFQTSEIAQEFEQAVVDVLVKKTLHAAKHFGVKHVLLAGGVAANRLLRESLQIQCSEQNKVLFMPPIRLCSDNAVYIASAAYFSIQGDLSKLVPVSHPSWLDIVAQPSLSIDSH